MSPFLSGAICSVDSAMSTEADQRCSLCQVDFGVLKPFKPMRFHNPDWYSSDGFRRHGIWEVVGKRRNKPLDAWYCTIRRIATARADCRIGEEFEFHEDYLVESMYYDPDALAVFR